MTGKIWRGSKKLLAFALALVMVVGAIQTVPMVRAEEGNTDITFTLATTQSYNIANQTLKFTVKSNSSKPIKYYVRGAYENEDMENFFKSNKAHVLSSGSGDVSSGMSESIYVWYVTGNEPYTTISENDYSVAKMYYYNKEYMDKQLCTNGTNKNFYEDQGNLIGWSPTVSYNDAKGCFSVVDNNTNTYGDYKTSNNLKLVQMIYFSTSNPGSGDDPGKRIQHRGTEYPIVGSDGKLNASIDILPDLNEDGYYTCYFWLEGTLADGSKKRSTVYKYSTFQYKKGQSLPKVSNIKWDDTTPGKITFNKVTDSNCSGKVSGYYITLYRQAPGDGTAAFGKVQWVGGTETNPACDFNKFMTDANAQYWVSIRTNSNAPLEWSNSDEALSPKYSPSTASNTLKETIKNATDVVTALKNNKVILRMAMQTDQSMVDKIKEIESTKGKKATVEISGNDIFAPSVTNNNIDVVGAGVSENAAPKIEVQKSTATGGSDYTGKRQVALEISLKKSGSAVTNELAIPVTITMPVPVEINNPDKLIILHMNGSNGIEETLYPRYIGDKISFTVTKFSPFVFVEVDNKVSAVGGSSGSGGGRQDDTVEALITVAEAGATVKTKDITTLSNSTMKALLKRGDVTLVMEYTYQGVDYVVTIPAGKAVDNDIPWYGPLYLAGMYGNGTGADKADKTADTVYVVKRGDTMSKIAKLSGMSLAELAKKNPQIKNLNRIRVGQSINR